MDRSNRARSRSFLASAFLAVAPFAPAFGGDASTADSDAADVARWRAHYAAAEAELLAGDAGITDPGRLAKRAAVRAALADYRARAEFGVAADADGARPFLFVDEGGRRCAMAMLLDRFGGGHLTERIARSDNGAMVIDLAGDPEVVAWIERLGITVEEAARIQAPGIIDPARGFEGSVNEPPPSFRSGGNGAPTYGGPGDGPGRPGSGGPATGGPSAGAGSGGPVIRGPATGGPESGARSAGASEVPEWLAWWEYNKLDFLLAPRAERLEPGVTRSRDALAFEGVDRAALLALLSRQLGATEPELRAAGAIAYGRIAGAEAHAPLVGLLTDAQEHVRHAALLGLGMVGDMPSIALLLDVARDGALGTERITADGREVARVALGLARRRGQSPELDRAVAGLAADDPDYAAMLYPALAASASDGTLRGFGDAIEAAFDNASLPVAVRARALESLALSGADESASSLSHALGAPRRELRPSAALALAESGHPLAFAALATASEVEANVATRSTLLVALGRIGEPAQDFLARELVRGSASSAPFAALGLAIAVRQHDEPRHRFALREAARGAKSDETRGAYVLALGIARDAEAVGQLADVLETSGNATVRSYAAQALGMVGTPEAHAALIAAVPRERQARARVGLAHGLAQFRRSADAPVLAELLASVIEPDLANQLAPALVFHDTREAFELAVAWATDMEQPRVTRAAAVEAVGQLADARPRFAVAQLARQANHEHFPPWLERLWAFGL